jgi:hypothetical protein
MSCQPATPEEPEPEVHLLHSLYDYCRLACMNEIYYAGRVTRLTWWSQGADILAAVTASSAIISWAIWQTTVGKVAWVVLTATTTVVSVVRPVLKWDVKLQKLASLHVKYRALFYDVEQLVSPIQLSRRVPSGLGAAIAAIAKKYRTVAIEDEIPLKKSLDRARADALKKYPPGSFWIPAGPRSENRQIREA